MNSVKISLTKLVHQMSQHQTEDGEYPVVRYHHQNDNNDSDRQSRATVTGKHDTQPDRLKYNTRRTIGCE